MEKTSDKSHHYKTCLGIKRCRNDFNHESRDKKKRCTAARQKRICHYCGERSCNRFSIKSGEFLNDNEQVLEDKLSSESLDCDDDSNGNQECIINDLPCGLLQTIFKYLPIADLLRRALLVCKYWHETAHDATLWRYVPLKGQVKVDDAVLLRLTSLSDNVQHLDMTDSRLVTTDGIINVARQCPHLLTLKMVRYQQIKTEAIFAIAECCHKLENLSLDCCFALSNDALVHISKGCPRLKKLSVNQCSRVSDIGIEAIAINCKQLQHLAANQCNKISDRSMEALSKHCKELRVLALMSCNINVRGISYLKKIPGLKILELSHNSNVTNASIMELAGTCKTLESLNVSLCYNIDDECVKYVAKNAKCLKSLYVVSCKVSDEALISLADHSTCIEHLDAGWNAGITDDGVKIISEKCKNLKYLGLMRCDKVSVSCTEDLVRKYPAITYSTMYLDCKRLIEKATREGLLQNPPPLMFDNTTIVRR